MKGLRIAMAAALMAVAAFAAAQTGGEYQDPQVTECWDCHAPGRWAPPMNPNYEVFPLRVSPAVGEEFAFQAQLINTWRANQQDMFLTLDISQAPSLGFVGGEPPFGDLFDGTIVVEPSAPADPLDPGQNFLTQPHRESVGIEVPTGATDLRIRMVPGNTDTTAGPDLTMRVFDGRTPYSPTGNPSVVVDDNGPGASETYHVQGASEVAGHGYGNWTIEAEVIPLRANTNPNNPPQLDPQPTEVPFTVIVDAWFNTTQETQQIQNKAGPVQPGGREIFTWTLMLSRAPGADESITVIANVTTHYDHEDAANPDLADMTASRPSALETVDGQTSFGFELKDVVITEVTPGGVTMATISEAIGYAATFLLVTSVWTGGMFGKASRRQLNTIFRSARRRVAFHNVLSYGIIAAATAHMVIFVWDTIEPNYPWQLGLIWGGLAIIAMLGLGITGALQVPMIRKWNYATWRWIHFGLAIAAIVFTIVHILLDGTHFGVVQDWVGWEDPLVPEGRT